MREVVVRWPAAPVNPCRIALSVLVALQKSVLVEIIEGIIYVFRWMFAHIVAHHLCFSQFTVNCVEFFDVVQAVLCKIWQVSFTRLSAERFIGVLIPLRIVALRPSSVNLPAVVGRIAYVYALAAWIVFHQLHFFVNHALTFLLQRVDIVVELACIVRRVAFAPVYFGRLRGLLQVFCFLLRFFLGTVSLAFLRRAFLVFVNLFAVEVFKRSVVVRLWC